MDAFRRGAMREIYRNPYVAVEVHQVVHPTGKAGEHLLLRTPPICAVVVADGGDLLFARQPRFAVEREELEIVKGGSEEGESTLDGAKRELREELGIVAAEWEDLGVLYEIPSIVASPVALFSARGIEHVDPEPEAIEQIELVRVPEKMALAAAASGRIDDAITLAALLRYGLRNGLLEARDSVNT